MEKTVLAIDPGSHKCGMALVRRSANGDVELLWRTIVPPEAVLPHLHDAYAVHPFSLVIIGEGTSSSQMIRAIREHLPAMGTLVVNERETSLQARERYWEHHPRKGWRKLLPSSLQVPPEPVDDFAALVIAERVLIEP